MAKRTPPKARGSSPHDQHAESEFLQKGLPCDNPECGSSDAVAEYVDTEGGAAGKSRFHCFSCGKTTFEASGSRTATVHHEAASEELQEIIDSGTVRLIDSRKITQATCQVWEYTTRINPRTGDKEQLAVYRDERGKAVGVKVRNTGREGTQKDFYWVGSSKDNLYGRHKWSGGGKVLTVLEGEIDTLTVSQCYSNKFPVVGIPNGAHEAEKCFRKNLEWISSFDKVVIGFDMDDQGRDAAKACAALLPPGKAFIAHWGRKDPNEMLLHGESEAITRAIWGSEAYRPDGIVDARTLTELGKGDVPYGLPWPWQDMTLWTYGRRYGELYVFGAGYGIGKTDAENEVIASTLSGRTKYGIDYTPEGCCVFTYEGGGPVLTKKAIAGKLWGKRFHIPKEDNGVSWTDQDYDEAMAFMDTECWRKGGKLFINDAKGASDWETVKARARYLHHAENIRHFFIDPISALTAGADDERKMIDRIILEGAHLAAELQSCIYMYSHLTRPKDGPPHEEGGQVRSNHFRGSGAIGMYADFCFGIERNTQADDEAERMVSTFRVVKDRYTGLSNGKTHSLVYDQFTGTLDERTTQFTGDI